MISRRRFRIAPRAASCAHSCSLCRAMALRLRAAHCPPHCHLPTLRLPTLVRQPHLQVVPSRQLAYARKPSHRPPGPSGSPVPPKSQTLAPKPPPPPASRGSSGGIPPPGFWPKVEFFKEYFVGGFAFLAILAAVLWWAAERVPETSTVHAMLAVPNTLR